MVNTSHSRSVRGTFSNPKTQQSLSSSSSSSPPSAPSAPPSLGDATSLQPENSTLTLPAHDSAPPPPPSSPSLGSTHANDTKARQSIGTRRAGERGGGGELPHSKTVRGTLASGRGKQSRKQEGEGGQVNKTQVGDPASLKAEMSDGIRDVDPVTEREGGGGDGREGRKEERVGKSKL